jgi:hypothetical protein
MPHVVYTTSQQMSFFPVVLISTAILSIRQSKGPGLSGCQLGFVFSCSRDPPISVRNDQHSWKGSSYRSKTLQKTDHYVDRGRGVRLKVGSVKQPIFFVHHRFLVQLLTSATFPYQPLLQSVHSSTSVPEACTLRCPNFR